jgi:sulfur relay (sulfurtransferase) DsrC/TusE family protein
MNTVPSATITSRSWNTVMRLTRFWKKYGIAPLCVRSPQTLVAKLGHEKP